jgi:chromosome segregation protein
VRISKLKIFGFKSFAQKTEINFPGNGLTAIVGPNGCGKSNIVDAIRWVLGEQRAGQLRMSKMQDVIFSGTEERAAMGMAEVSLILENNNGELPSEYTEVMLTRRAHRSGVSEYLINNQECRLKDIQNLFFDSGLGTGSYSQMNEGMINAVLSDKAEERRVLFEEAAGVSKYKQQRKETVRQLERVRLDMERVEDNLRHVRSSVRQYEKQADKTREWKLLRSRLRELDLSLSLDRYDDHKQNMKILEDARRRISSDQESAKTRLTVLETQIEEKRLAISGDEENLRELEGIVKQTELFLNDLNNRLMRYRENVASLNASIEKNEEEIESSKLRMESLFKEKTECEAIVREGSGSEIEEKTREFEREQEMLQVLRDSCDELRAEERVLSEKRISILNKLNSLKSRWQRVDAEVGLLESNAEKWTEEKIILENQKEEATVRLETLEKSLNTLQRETELLEEKRLVQLESNETLRQEILALERSFHEHKKKEAGLLSRLEVLRSMDVSDSDASQWLLENRSGLVSGLLGENVEVDPRYLAAVESLLGDVLNAVIAQRAEEVSALLESLDNANAGQVLMALDRGIRGNPGVSFENVPGVKGLASEWIRAQGKLSALSERLFSRWVLVEDLASALRLSEEYAAEDYWFFTAEGKAVHTSGLIRGGAGKGQGFLSRRTEIRETERLQETLIQEIQTKETALERHRSILDSGILALNSLTEDLAEKSRQIRIEESAGAVERNTLGNLEQRLARLENDLSQVRLRMETVTLERNSDEELALAEAAAALTETEYQKLTGRLAEQTMLYRNKEDEVGDLRTYLGMAQTLIAEKVSRIRSIDEQTKMLREMIDIRTREIADFTVKLGEMEVNVESLADGIQAKHEELSAQERDRDVARERYEAVSGDLEDWRSEVRSINASLLERANELSDVSRRIDSLGMNIERLRERIFSEWEVDLDSPENAVRIEYEEREARREMSELREKIKALGPVNQGIMEDYEGEKQRLLEVETQFDDLDRARASLERTINKLDAIARERFMDTFHRIQKNFQEVFSRLMHDGGTKLTLQEGVDPLEAEIEVNARPTGKKMRGVRALSGGERALTAVSLLFAIYMEKPSPYCVLDEVDGPLDDANIGRFVELLRHFSRQTQFVLVTHNKRTMAASDMLYGVTQEIKGISRIASVKLDDAVGFAL